jgi:hypothetical protein
MHIDKITKIIKIPKIYKPSKQLFQYLESGGLGLEIIIETKLGNDVLDEGTC